jgi:hypothetical protein
MSRSFKKIAGFVDHGRNTWQDKRIASKKVRNTQDVINGAMYKKVYCSWEICDFKFLEFCDPRLKEDYKARRK